MTLLDFLARYGAVALFLLATVEGDVSLVVGGVLAHRGLLGLPEVMMAGALGNLTGDLGWFAMGRHLRERIRTSGLYRKVGPRIEALAERLGGWQLLAARVVYGTRNASMLFWGQHGMPLGRFLLIDLLGCSLAAGLFATAGYLLGHGTTAIAGELKHVELLLLIAVVVGGLLAAGVTRLVRRRVGDR
jgi:membrane protein DedA with SNARE-associated domain